MRSNIVPRCSFAPQQNVVVHDVNGCIRSWGKRGLWMGALFGLVGGALLANSPFVIGALPFGIIGTLMLCAAESAIIAGGIGDVEALSKEALAHVATDARNRDRQSREAESLGVQRTD